MSDFDTSREQARGYMAIFQTRSQLVPPLQRPVAHRAVFRFCSGSET